MKDLIHVYQHLMALGEENQKIADRLERDGDDGEYYCYVGGKAFAYQVAAAKVFELIGGSK